DPDGPGVASPGGRQPLDVGTPQSRGLPALRGEAARGSRAVRRPWRGAVAALFALSLAGCAVGNFIAGAPSSRERDTADGLLSRRCGGCHAIPDPAEMTGAEWQDALASMHRRVRLPASEWDSLAAKRREVRRRRPP